jgi:PrtD family type I secretion system ABC transporter
MAKNNNILKQSIQACSSKLAVVIFFSFFINILMFVAPLHMLQMYDRVLVSRSEVTLIALTGLAIGLLMIYGLLEAVRSRIMTRIGLEFDELMSGRMLNMVFEIAVNRPSISSPQQLIRDADLVRDFIGGPAIIALCDAPWVPVFIAVCFFLHPVLGFIALCGAIMVFGLAASNEWLTREKISEANKLWIKASNESAVSLRNSEIVKALGMLGGIKESWTKNRDSALTFQSTAADRASAIVACSRFVRMGLQVVILAAGGYLAIMDQISPGTMIAASIIMGRALAPVEMAVSQWKNFIAVRDAYNRINDMVDGHPEEPEVMDLPAPVGKVSLNGVFIKAPEQPSSNMIVQNVSLDFTPGTITGIIGPSGCGKSSLVRTIVGVWPVFRGSVRYDGANIENWSSEKLGPYIGYMPQGVELFGGTVAQNICRFTDINSEEIILAAKKADVHDLILKLPDGYDTNIGVAGHALSGGQKQRIALARALYLSPKVIVLDEPNSNLDNAGEKALTDAIIGAKNAGATVIVVSHRPSLITNTDNIAVLNNGSVVKAGPRDTILRELGGGQVPANNPPTPANS